MGAHPFNLAVRFILELIALFAIGLWGWKQGEGINKYFLAIGLPIILAIIWGAFAVPDDPSRSGKAPIPTSGIIRLSIELAIFTLAIYCFYVLGYGKVAVSLGIIVFLHYAISYDRITWLLKR